jgi:hypothetical protein
MSRDSAASTLTATYAQLITARPTRAALAWSMLSKPLTPYPAAAARLASSAPIVAVKGEPAPGSLAHACLAFQRHYRLAPITLDRENADDPARRLAIRRLAFHDALHALLDFEADWPGQLGVFCFVAAQRYCPEFETAARTLAQIYVTAAPWLRDPLHEAEYRGREIAHTAPLLLAMPLQELLEEPLIALRRRLSLRQYREFRPIEEARLPSDYCHGHAKLGDRSRSIRPR